MRDINPAWIAAAVGIFVLGGLFGIWFESVATPENHDEPGETCITYYSKTGGFGGGPDDCTEHVHKWCMDLNNDSVIQQNEECGAQTLYDSFRENSGEEQ